jgi:2-C-methyl-D-erythritol 2,4-cyclodiphosphate synthase
MSHRVGQGFDVHRLVAGRRLILGGVEVPHDRGLAGHSDGDCLTHAICDALLGAAGKGDMGRHFPSTDERWKDAASRVFLEEAARLVAAAGYVVESVDATVIAESPRLGPHTEAMRRSLALVLAIDEGAVSVKAKSCDGLGAVGRGEGVAACAVALLRKDG